MTNKSQIRTREEPEFFAREMAEDPIISVAVRGYLTRRMASIVTSFAAALTALSVTFFLLDSGGDQFPIAVLTLGTAGMVLIIFHKDRANSLNFSQLVSDLSQECRGPFIEAKFGMSPVSFASRVTDDSMRRLVIAALAQKIRAEKAT